MTVRLEGTFDGASTNPTYGNVAQYVFDNALNGLPGTLDLYFAKGGKLHLEWATLVMDDQSVSATGTLTMPSQGPHPGQLYCIGAATVTPHAGYSTSFTLSSLSRGACPGTPVSGSLQGCAAGAG